MNESGKTKMLRFLQNDEDGGEGLISEYLFQGEYHSQNPGFQANQLNHTSMYNAGNDNMATTVSSPTEGICKNIQDSIRDNRTKCSPLGLKLTISPSFLNLVEAKLYGNNQYYQDSNSNRLKRSRPSGSLGSSSMPDKLKASNSPMNSLVIGQWQRFSIHEGDLTAKVYYLKRKIVWEIWDGALKSKMEILWSEITGLRLTSKPKQHAMVFEIELEQPPLFYREANPQPRKHTIWHQSPDFTGGQAAYWRKHSVSFSEGVFDKHYEKLLQCDQRLARLSRGPFPRHELPHFNTTMSNNYYELPSNSNEAHNPKPIPGLASSPSLPPIVTNPPILGMPSYANDTEMINLEKTFWNEQAMNFTMGGIGTTQGIGTESSMMMNVQDNHAYNPYTHQLHRGAMVSLTDIEQHLLGDSQTIPFDDDGTLEAQVETMCSLLEHDNNTDQPQVVGHPENQTNNVTSLENLCTTHSINWADERFEMVSVDNILDSLQFDFSDI